MSIELLTKFVSAICCDISPVVGEVVKSGMPVKVGEFVGDLVSILFDMMEI